MLGVHVFIERHVIGYEGLVLLLFHSLLLSVSDFRDSLVSLHPQLSQTAIQHFQVKWRRESDDRLRVGSTAQLYLLVELHFLLFQLRANKQKRDSNYEKLYIGCNRSGFLPSGDSLITHGFLLLILTEMERQFFAATCCVGFDLCRELCDHFRNTFLESQIPVDEPPAPPHTNPLNATKLSALAPTLRIIQNCAAEIRKSVKTV